MLSNGCEKLFLWNPVFNGMELEESISFLFQGVSVSISEFGFVNVNIGPEVHLSFENKTSDTLDFSLGGFLAVWSTDTIRLRPDQVTSISIAPDESWKSILFFEGILGGHRTDDGGVIFTEPGPTVAFFGFPEMKTKSRSFQIPSLEYRDPSRHKGS